MLRMKNSEEGQPIKATAPRSVVTELAVPSTPQSELPQELQRGIETYLRDNAHLIAGMTDSEEAYYNSLTELFLLENRVSPEFHKGVRDHVEILMVKERALLKETAQEENGQISLYTNGEETLPVSPVSRVYFAVSEGCCFAYLAREGISSPRLQSMIDRTFLVQSVKLEGLEPSACIRDAAFSPNGKWLALIVEDGAHENIEESPKSQSIRLYDANSFRELGRINGWQGEIQSIGFTDGSTVVTTSWDEGTTSLCNETWDFSSRKNLKQALSKDDAVRYTDVVEKFRQFLHEPAYGPHLTEHNIDVIIQGGGSWSRMMNVSSLTYVTKGNRPIMKFYMGYSPGGLSPSAVSPDLTCVVGDASPDHTETIDSVYTCMPVLTSNRASSMPFEVDFLPIRTVKDALMALRDATAVLMLLPESEQSRQMTKWKREMLTAVAATEESDEIFSIIESWEQVFAEVTKQLVKPAGYYPSEDPSQLLRASSGG